MVEKISTELKLQGKSDKTIKMYNFFNIKFLEFIKKDISEIKEDDVKKYLADLIARDKDIGTVALARSSLRYFYDSIMRKNITNEIKTPKKNRKLPDVLTKAV